MNFVMSSMYVLLFATCYGAALAMADPPCDAYPDCQNCVSAAIETCGWCKGRCVVGNATASSNGQCSGSTWHWHGFNCPAIKDCSQYVNCNECGSNGLCGWCNNQCYPGTSSGPNFNGQCGSFHWHWNGYQCQTMPPSPIPPVPPTGCAVFSSCTHCTNNHLGDCGWCNNRCLEGTSMGPSHGHTCGDSFWHWEYDTCPSTCGQFANCAACTGETFNCGWCDGQCLGGNNTGPVNGGQCHGHTWHWTGGRCPLPPPNCSGHQSCSACTSAPSGECGWCGFETGECLQGNSSSPLSGACPNASQSWHWNGLNCPVPPPTPAPPSNCVQWPTCDSCTGLGDLCGWCASSGRCEHGDGTGPTGHGLHCNASDWHWDGEHCPTPQPTPVPLPTCGVWTNCAECVAAPSGRCGFCSGDKVCSEGTSLGPSNMHCKGVWQWYADSCPAV